MRKFPTPPGAPGSANSARSYFSWLWLGPGSYPMGPGSSARYASGQTLRLSKHSAAARTVLLVTWKSNPSQWTGNSTAVDDKVVPAMKARMPGASTSTIWVQQGGAKPHTRYGVLTAIEAAAGENFILETQPPNSPDLHILDLGFSHSIQLLKDGFLVTNVRELVEA
ncbi:unnamed protein product, partial [Discosporangium mesarthrocarpum]